MSGLGLDFLLADAETNPFRLVFLSGFMVHSLGTNSQQVPAHPYTAMFSRPQRVTISSYSGDGMEPFLSRDGRYLFSIA
jgi:hypothetical protein